MGAVVLALAFYAGGDDSYYGGGVSRWEHAGRAGSHVFVVALFGVAAAMSIGVAVLGSRKLGFAVPAVAVYLLALAVLWVALNGGH